MKFEKISYLCLSTKNECLQNINPVAILRQKNIFDYFFPCYWYRYQPVWTNHDKFTYVRTKIKFITKPYKTPFVRGICLNRKYSSFYVSQFFVLLLSYYMPLICAMKYGIFRRCFNSWPKKENVHKMIYILLLLHL